MLEMFYPQRYEVSAYVIPYDHYHAQGIRGVIFDVDNTLVPHDAPADDQARELFRHLHEMGMETCLLSNNKEPRVKAFAEDVGSAYIYKAGKPGTAGYGTNRAGILSILVKPINPKEEIQIVLKRYLEKPVLYFYERHRRRKA